MGASTTRNRSTTVRRRAAELRHAEERRQRRRQLLWRGGLGLLVAGAAGGIVAAAALGGSSTPDQPTAGRPLAASAALPPWPAPADTAAHVNAAGLSLGPMGTAEHYHAHLDVIVDGKPVTVPADIGVDARTGQMSALHTHDATGLIHVESARVGQPFTLGQLFTQWNVRLSGQQLGGLRAGAGKALAVYVDGKPVEGDPATIRIRGHQQIALVYGAATDKVDVPATYDFGDE